MFTSIIVLILNITSDIDFRIMIHLFIEKGFFFLEKIINLVYKYNNHKFVYKFFTKKIKQIKERK